MYHTLFIKGELSWSKTGIIGVDNQIELKRLCGFKKKVSPKLAWNRFKSTFRFRDDVIAVHMPGQGYHLPMFSIQNEHY